MTYMDRLSDLADRVVAFNPDLTSAWSYPRILRGLGQLHWMIDWNDKSDEHTAAIAMQLYQDLLQDDLEAEDLGRYHDERS